MNQIMVFILTQNTYKFILQAGELNQIKLNVEAATFHTKKHVSLAD